MSFGDLKVVRIRVCGDAVNTFQIRFHDVGYEIDACAPKTEGYYASGAFAH
jgi:hypothetical protein